MSGFLKYIGLTGSVSVWFLAHTVIHMWGRSCNARACHHCGWHSVQRDIRGLDAAMLEHVVVVGSPYSKSYVDWMLQCWSRSWSKLVLAAWSCRVERAWWLRLNRVLELQPKWTDRVITAKVCHALAHAKSSELIGEARALPTLTVQTYQEVRLKALPRLSRMYILEKVAKA